MKISLLAATAAAVLFFLLALGLEALVWAAASEEALKIEAAKKEGKVVHE